MVELSLTGAQNQAGIGFAGDTLNTAIYLRRSLPKEHEVAFVSMIGSDPLSARMADFIAGEGIDISRLRRHSDLLPGIYAINTDLTGERSFSYWRENSAARQLFQGTNGLDFSVLEPFDVIYFSAITLAILPADVRAALLNWIKAFRANGGLFAFDSNYRPQLWSSPEVARDTVAQAWQICDIALPSEDDEVAMFGDESTEELLNRFASYGVQTGALKRGELGPLPINRAPDPALKFPPATNVVDTTAAGDSFVGAFLAKHLTGGTLSDALLAGHACACEVIGVQGAIIPRVK